MRIGRLTPHTPPAIAQPPDNTAPTPLPSAISKHAPCAEPELHLVLSPLILGLMLHLSNLASPTARLADLLLEQMEQTSSEQLYLPLSASSQLHVIARQLAQVPGNRSTMAEWASQVAMSERSLARLVKRETGLTFWQWRKRWQIIGALQSLAEGASVQRAAEAFGYESVSSFISMFRKTLGASPGRYWKKPDNWTRV